MSVANAGMLSASRYPLAMSRDHLLPDVFRRLSRFGTPLHAIAATLTAIVMIIVLFDPVGSSTAQGQLELLLNHSITRDSHSSPDRY